MKKSINIIATIILFLISGISFGQKTNPDSLVIGTADKHQKMMDILYTPTKVPIKKIGILLYLLFIKTP